MMRRTVKRFRDAEDLRDRPRKGTLRSKRIPYGVKAVREQIRRYPGGSILKIALQSAGNPRTMRRIVQDDLKMLSFTLQRKHTLTDAHKQKSLNRSIALLREMKSGTAG